MTREQRTQLQLAACRREFGDACAEAHSEACEECGAIVGWAHARNCTLDRYPALSANPIYI